MWAIGAGNNPPSNVKSAWLCEAKPAQAEVGMSHLYRLLTIFLTQSHQTSLIATLHCYSWGSTQRLPTLHKIYVLTNTSFNHGRLCSPCIVFIVGPEDGNMNIIGFFHTIIWECRIAISAIISRIIVFTATGLRLSSRKGYIIKQHIFPGSYHISCHNIELTSNDIIQTSCIFFNRLNWQKNNIKCLTNLSK